MSRWRQLRLGFALLWDAYRMDSENFWHNGVGNQPWTSSDYWFRYGLNLILDSIRR